MKKLVILALVASAVLQVAKRYDINSLEDLKNFLMPKLQTA